MRPSSLRHPVAILRTLLGMSQSQFASLVDIPVATLQAIELGPKRLKMTREQALQIGLRTGVDMEWLLNEKPDAPIVSGTNRPYSHEHFQRAQVASDAPADEHQTYVFFLHAAARLATILFDDKGSPALSSGDLRLLRFRLAETYKASAGEDPRLEKFKELTRYLEPAGFGMMTRLILNRVAEAQDSLWYETENFIEEMKHDQESGYSKNEISTDPDRIKYLEQWRKEQAKKDAEKAVAESFQGQQAALLRKQKVTKKRRST